MPQSESTLLDIYRGNRFLFAYLLIDGEAESIMPAPYQQKVAYALYKLCIKSDLNKVVNISEQAQLLTEIAQQLPEAIYQFIANLHSHGHIFNMETHGAQVSALYPADVVEDSMDDDTSTEPSSDGDESSDDEVPEAPLPAPCSPSIPPVPYQGYDDYGNLALSGVTAYMMFFAGK